MRGSGRHYFFSMCLAQLFKHHGLKDFPLPIELPWHLLLENQLTLYAWVYFWIVLCSDNVFVYF